MGPCFFFVVRTRSRHDDRAPTEPLARKVGAGEGRKKLAGCDKGTA